MTEHINKEGDVSKLTSVDLAELESEKTGDKDTISSTGTMTSKQINYVLELYLKPKDASMSNLSETTSDWSFDSFFSEAQVWFGKKYEIHNESLFKSLIQSFFFLAEREKRALLQL